MSSEPRPRGRPRAFHDKTDQNTVQALDRALGLLSTLAAAPGMTLSELAETSGQAVATVYRALVTLQGHAMVELEEPGQVWQNGQWVDDIPAAVERRYSERVEEIDATCSLQITSGFWSAVLGERYCYSTTLDDQVNLSGAASLGVDLTYPCADQDGIKAYRPHTAAQLRQVADSFTRMRLQLLQQAYSLKEGLQQARDAKDLAGLEAVVWEAAQV